MLLYILITGVIYNVLQLITNSPTYQIKVTFKESDALSPGESFTVIETPYCKIGLGICYDIRFPDLAQIYARKYGCELLVYPGAFTMITGLYTFNGVLGNALEIK